MTLPELPQPNIPLLRKAVEWAETEAAKTDGTCLWDQSTWTHQTECGTAYCIAGYIVSISTVPGLIINSANQHELSIDGKATYWDEVSDSLLGLTLEEGDRLYNGSNDIADIRRVAERIAARAGERL